MKKNKGSVYKSKCRFSIIVLLLYVIIIHPVAATDAIIVTDASSLLSAVSSATSPDGVHIELGNNIELDNSTLTISSGNIIKLDLNGYTLSATRTSDGAATCISVDGGSLIINGGGTISAISKGQSSSWIKSGYSAVAISYNGGSIGIQDVIVEAKATEGSGLGKDGKAYTLDPKDKTYTVNDMIPYGAYIEGASNDDYSSDGYPGNALSSTTTVSLVKYVVSYDTSGGNTVTEGKSSYTIESTGFQLPDIEKKGYDLVNWLCNGSSVALSRLPTTSLRAATDSLTFTANWEITKYTIKYEVNGGTSIPESSYTIEQEVKSLPTPNKDGYQFIGWYDHPGFEGDPVGSIPSGSTGDKVFYAKWSEIYSIRYAVNEGVMPSSYVTSYYKEQRVDLPEPAKENALFIGWYEDDRFSGNPYLFWLPNTMEGNKSFYAKWSQRYKITYELNGGKNVADPPVEFSKDDLSATVLPTKPTRYGYNFSGWYDNAGLEGREWKEIPLQSEGDKTFYAKWTPAEYTISYDLYYGSFPPDGDKPEKYTIISEDVILPVPVRDGFTFAGWYTDDLLSGDVQTVIPSGSAGNKTFYAKWTAGSVVSFVQPAHGKITVRNGNTEIKNNDKVGVGVTLTITATPDSSIYSLSKLLVNGKESSSPCTVQMPEQGGLTISAEFTDSRPAVSAPKITTNPVHTEYIPSGENVMITLEKTDEASVLYYSISGSTPKAYTRSFPVSMSTGKESTVQIQAIARKEGFKDGIATRDITFRPGKITIAFLLPKGITAHNPEGGEVISAIASGGTFEFMLKVDKNYFQSLDTLRVLANGKEISPDAYGIYTLSGQTANVTVKVSGITGVTHLVVLKQSPNGQIYFTEDKAISPLTANHGDNISVTAEADENYKFFSWTDGNQANPRTVTVEKDMELKARFVTQDPGYSVILPELEGVEVRALSGYPTEVKRGGTFKFYLRLEDGYSESVPGVYANGEKLTVYKDVYSIYNISSNVIISVDGIRENKAALVLTDHVTATVLETGADAAGEPVKASTLLTLYAKAPEGKVFSKWNDGKSDNPRIVAAKEAPQLFPLFVASSGAPKARVILPVIAGAGIGVVNANADAVPADEEIKLKVVLLPQYSKSKVKVTANGRELTQALSLRASSETATLFYTLAGVREDVQVEVTGLELNTCSVSLQQTEGGSIHASQSGLLKYGTAIELNAVPVPGKMFMKWSDGNTLNPYSYIVTGDCTLSAQFIASDLPVGNEMVSIPTVRIYTAPGLLHLQSPEPFELSVWDMKGKLIKRVVAPAGNSTCSLPAGMYFVRIGDTGGKKVIIR